MGRIGLRLRLLVAISIILIIAALAKLYPTPQQPSVTPPRMVLKEAPVMTGFKLTEYDAGDKTFTVSAKKMYLRNKQIKPFGFRIAVNKSTEMEDVEATFYKGNKPISYLNSKYGVIDMNSKDIIFSDNPSLVSEHRRTLNAEEIVWNNLDKRLLARGQCLLGLEGKMASADFINTDVELMDFTMGGKK